MQIDIARGRPNADVSEQVMLGAADRFQREYGVWLGAVPATGTTQPLETLRAHLAASRMAVFKRPEKLLVIEQLQRNSVGKVVRPELAKLAEATHAAG